MSEKGIGMAGITKSNGLNAWRKDHNLKMLCGPRGFARLNDRQKSMVLYQSLVKSRYEANLGLIGML